MEKFLTVRQLEERLQVDRMTIYRMLQSGRLTGVKVGGQWRFREDDLRQVVAAAPAVAETPGGEPSLPLPCLQAMQQLFSEAAEVAAVVVDPHGHLLTELTNDCAYCNLILSSDAGRRRCLDTWAALAGLAEAAPRLHRCHAGLLCARAAIYVEGRALASVIACQALADSEPAEPQPARLADLAAAFGIPPSRLQEAYPAIHRHDDASLEKMLHLLKTLGVAACRIGAERQRLVAKLDRIAEISKER